MEPFSSPYRFHAKVAGKEVLIEVETKRIFVSFEGDPRQIAPEPGLSANLARLKATEEGYTHHSSLRHFRYLAGAVRRTWGSWWSRVAAREVSRVRRPPGSILLALVDFAFSQKSVEQIFRPIIAEWRYEYFEAIKARHRWKARWLSVRHTYGFLVAMGLSKIFSFFKNPRSISK